MCDAPSLYYQELGRCVGTAVERFLEIERTDPDSIFAGNISANLDRIKSGELFTNEMRVPDVLRRFDTPHEYPAEIDSVRIGGPPNNDIDIGKLDHIPRKQLVSKGSVVMLLESPHHHEYEYPQNESIILPSPVAPAQGTTGVAIKEFYNRFISRWNRDVFSAHPLILMNPIQWQTSLHYYHRQALVSSKGTGRLRDTVWKTLWSQERIKQCCTTRLKRYNPLVVVNCCTGGKNRWGLNALVEREIRGTYTTIRERHPSSWRQENFAACDRLIPLIGCFLIREGTLCRKSRSEQ